MKLFLAVTDNDWFRFLRRRPEVDEVNFWQPGGSREFKTLRPGEPFLFKLHSPENFVVGGGFFAHASLLPASLAWEAFGEKNGAATHDEFRKRLVRLRREPLSPREDPNIGCVILVQPFFFDEVDWIPVPPDFSLNIVQGKSYDARQGEGRKLWDRVSSILHTLQPQAVAEPQAEMFGELALVRPRLGQGSFRILVTDTYHRRCAVTGEKALPVLEAAHIKPVAEGGRHQINNGLLLRSDVHKLFDRGYISITPQHRVLVSRKLKEDFDNGEPYYPLAGQEIRLPQSADERPRAEFLEWHANTVFRG
jgi:putative restriction endonuclease